MNSSREKNEGCPEVVTASECNSGCIKWWIAGVGAAGSSILTLIIVLLSIWIYFKCCTKKKRSKRKLSKKQKKLLVSDRPPGTAVLDLSEKNNDKQTSPPLNPQQRKTRSYTPTSIYDHRKSYETEATTPAKATNMAQKQLNVNPDGKNVQASGERMEDLFIPTNLNLAQKQVVNPEKRDGKKASEEKMEEIYEPTDLHSKEAIIQPQTPRLKASKTSTMDLLRSDLFDRPSPNVYPKK